MPRLFDLLPDDTRKGLLADARKAAHELEKASAPARDGPVATHDAQRKPSVAIPDFVALDVETTGLDFKCDRIIEVGAVKFINGRIVGEFADFVNAGVPIPTHISELTNIRNEDIASASPFPQIADALLSFIGGLPLCGHQIEFDATFINEELKRAGRPEISFQLLDTALLSRILLQPLQRFSLKHVSEFLHVALDNAHRALHDARASGNVALQLLPKLTDMPLPLRQTIAACAPGSVFKSIVIKSLGNARPSVALPPRAPFGTFPKLGLPESPAPVDSALVNTIFSLDGSLTRTMKSFLPRPSQTDMAMQVTDALNSEAFLVAEAGTGTGKTLAYLIPAAMWALANSSRVIISTRTRNLQDQLVNRDLPLVASVNDNRLRYSVLKGRSNYLCLNRWFRLLSGEIGNLSPRERTAILPLIPWSQTTATGDIEEQNQFNPKWFSKIWNLVSAEHDCGGRRCPHFHSCFLQQARSAALSSHIVIINHALFFSEISSDTSFLGRIGPIVFDEAHHLESSGHRHLRVEIDSHRLLLFIEIINNLVQETGELKNDKELYSQGKELRSSLKSLRKRTTAFQDELNLWASKDQATQKHDFQIPYSPSSFSSCVEPRALESTLNEIIEILYHLKQAALSSENQESVEQLLSEIQSCAERASQLRADFQYLISAVTEDHVFWIEGNHDKGWIKLCGVPINVGEILSVIWEQCNGAVIFTSATLSVLRSVDYFIRGAGLRTFPQKTVTAYFKSPFGAHQAILGAIRSGPEPDSHEYPSYVASTLAALHQKFEKNILVLFTSNFMLNAVYEQLKLRSDIRQSKLLAQGFSGTRNSMLDQFRQSSSMILLGTDSFWEGIDVPGEACEIVVIPRLPFPVPTHPLTQAIAKKMEEVNGESFFSFSIPEAVIKFRQGAGRLIRSTTDRGALLVLDSRIITKGYGKQFSRSLDGEFRNFENCNDMIEQIANFFVDPDCAPRGNVTYVPLEDV